MGSDRAMLEWAYRVVVGFSAEDEVFVMRDMSIVTVHDRTVLDPSGDPLDALVVALAQTIKFRLRGVQSCELRRDLITAGMREYGLGTDVSHGPVSSYALIVNQATCYRLRV